MITFHGEYEVKNLLLRSISPNPINHGGSISQCNFPTEEMMRIQFEFETTYGIPREFIRIMHAIKEGLPCERGDEIDREIYSLMPVGIDLIKVWLEFILMIVTKLMPETKEHLNIAYLLNKLIKNELVDKSQLRLAATTAYCCGCFHIYFKKYLGKNKQQANDILMIEATLLISACIENYIYTRLYNRRNKNKNNADISYHAVKLVIAYFEFNEKKGKNACEKFSDIIIELIKQGEKTC